MSNKVEIIGYDDNIAHLKRREVLLHNGALKVYNDKLVDIDTGINNLELGIDTIEDCVNTDNDTLITSTHQSQDFNPAWNGSIWNNGTALIIDLIGYRAVRIWGTLSNSSLRVLATDATNTGNASFFDRFLPDITDAEPFSLYIPDCPRNIKFLNESGVDITAVELQYKRFK